MPDGDAVGTSVADVGVLAYRGPNTFALTVSCPTWSVAVEEGMANGCPNRISVVLVTTAGLAQPFTLTRFKFRGAMQRKSAVTVRKPGRNDCAGF